MAIQGGEWSSLDVEHLLLVRYVLILHLFLKLSHMIVSCISGFGFGYVSLWDVLVLGA